MKKNQTNKNILSDSDIERIGNILDTRLAPIATKKDLADNKKELENYIHEGVESIMAGMDKLSEQLAEKERVYRLKVWTRIIAEKVGVNLV